MGWMETVNSLYILSAFFHSSLAFIPFPKFSRVSWDFYRVSEVSPSAKQPVGFLTTASISLCLSKLPAYREYCRISGKEPQGNRKALRMLIKETAACDLRVAGYGELGKKDKFLFWGMLVGTLKYFREEEKILFLEYFLVFHTRSNLTMERMDKGLSIPILKWQSAMLLIVVEAWLKRNEPENLRLADEVNLLWHHGSSCCNR